MRALIVASTASMIDQFNMNNIALLQKLGYEVDVACNFFNPGTITKERSEGLKKRLNDINVNAYQIDFSRNVLKVHEHFKALKQMKHLLKTQSYDLLHCHSPIGGLIARVAAKKYRKKRLRVIYTAHGFHFYKGAPKKNWLIYYPLEKMCSKWTDILITINKEDYAFALKKMKAKKVEYVPGVGIDTSKFSDNLYTDQQIKQVRHTLNIRPDERMFLSVGELSTRKNHELVIKILGKLSDKKFKYFIVGKGELKDYLSSLISNNNLTDKVFLLGYRDDVSLLYRACDLFIFPSLQEGLPVALMEAIASKVPVICSSIRGNKELVQPNQTFNPLSTDDLLLKISEYYRHNYQLEVDLNYDNLGQFSSEVVNEKMLSCYGRSI